MHFGVLQIIGLPMICKARLWNTEYQQYDIRLESGFLVYVFVCILWYDPELLRVFYIMEVTY